jgi:hypothetical protein
MFDREKFIRAAPETYATEFNVLERRVPPIAHLLPK